MTDLGLLHYYLGVEVFQCPHHIFISHSKYAVDVLQRFGMQDCKPVLTPMEQNMKLSKFEGGGGGKVDSTTYRQLIGSLIYLTNNRPDLPYADLGISQTEATSLFIDSHSAIKLAKNPFFLSKTKHVETKYHHIRSFIAKDVLKLVYCPSEDQISDIFTKPLGRIKFTKFRDELGICCNLSLDHRGEC
eukprot:PITA_26590